MAGLNCRLHVEEDGANAAAKQNERQEEAAAVERELDLEFSSSFLVCERTEEEYEYDPELRTSSLVSRSTKECEYFSSDLPPTVFDLDEESTIGPMRHAYIDGPELLGSVNMLSIKVLEADDVEFPINVYGTVLARDDLDHKCVYLFRRDRDNPQTINSQGEMLALTGPSRGFVVIGIMSFEINLKIRCDQPVGDRDFSKGLVEYDSISRYSTIMSEKLTSRLSTVELTYAHVRRGVEATVQIKIVKVSDGSNSVRASTEKRNLCLNEKEGHADFYGKITACTTGIPNDIVLYDSEASSSATTVGGDGFVALCRRVIVVPIFEMLVLRIDARDGDGRGNLTAYTINFTPKAFGGELKQVYCACYKMQVEVVWSGLYIPKFDRLL